MQNRNKIPMVAIVGFWLMLVFEIGMFLTYFLGMVPDLYYSSIPFYIMYGCLFLYYGVGIIAGIAFLKLGEWTNSQDFSHSLEKGS